jgi:hypothetical protein
VICEIFEDRTKFFGNATEFDSQKDEELQTMEDDNRSAYIIAYIAFLFFGMIIGFLVGLMF